MTMNPPRSATVVNGGRQVLFSRRNLWAGILFGIGVMAFIDEVIFHQLLQWHHFYDLSTTRIGILSDGLLNSFAWFSAIFSLFLVADLRRRNAFWPRRWIGAAFLGAGVFQLFDGLINHKVLNIHQIRYDVNLLPYDLAWNFSAAILILIGLFMLSKTRSPQKNKRAVQSNA